MGLRELLSGFQKPKLNSLAAENAQDHAELSAQFETLGETDAARWLTNKGFIPVISAAEWNVRAEREQAAGTRPLLLLVVPQGGREHYHRKQTSMAPPSFCVVEAATPDSRLRIPLDTGIDFANTFVAVTQKGCRTTLYGIDKADGTLLNGSSMDNTATGAGSSFLTLGKFVFCPPVGITAEQIADILTSPPTDSMPNGREYKL